MRDLLEVARMSVTKFLLLLAVTLTVQKLSAQVPRNSPIQGTGAPLFLSINGSGTILPFHNGQNLQVGKVYFMQAVPNPRYVFKNWTVLYAYTSTLAFTNQGKLIFITNTTFASGPVLSRACSIRFEVQPEVTITSTPTVEILYGTGWQANFVRRDGPRHIAKIISEQAGEAIEP
jgi:hypothetical protein